MSGYTDVDRPPRVRVECDPKEKKTRQSEAKGCDVNEIMARYEKTGVLPVVSREPFYADVSTLGDYRSVVENVRQAEDYFARLPASVRSRFDNDAAAFLDFVSAGNREELEELGLLEKAPPVKAAEGTVEPPEGA